MLKKGTTSLRFYRGNYQPVRLYQGRNMIATWREQEKSAPAEWENTYLDTFQRITAKGNGSQDGTPSPTSPAQLIASSGTLTSSGQTFTDAETHTSVAALPTLRALPGTDICDTAEYLGDGKWRVTRHVGEVKLLSTGSFSVYSYMDTKGISYNALPGKYKRNAGICSHEANVANSFDISHSLMWIGVDSQFIYWVKILDVLGFTTKDEFKSWLAEQEEAGTPVTVWYALNTPTTEELDLGDGTLYTYPRQTAITVSGELVPDVTASARVVATDPIPTSSFADVQLAVRQGYHKYIWQVGQQFHVLRGGQVLDFDILDFDKHIPMDDGLTHSIALGLHNIFTYGKIPFCAPQLMYYTKGGLPAGNYKFTLDHAGYGGNTAYDGTYMFTLAQAVPADGGFRHTNFIGGSKPSYAQSDVIGNYITTYGVRPQRDVVESGVAVSVWDGTTECTDLGTFTARSLTYHTETDETNGGKRNFTERQAYGSNRWRDSVYRQWLNSTAPAGTTGNGVSNWWTPQSVFDIAPGDANSAGFLYGLDPSFVAAMGKVKVITALCDCDKVDGATQDITYDKVWLQSMTEVFGNTNNSISEGERLAYWNGSTDADRIKYHNGTARHWCLRSPHSTFANLVRIVSSSGALVNYGTYSVNGVAPACCIV